MGDVEFDNNETITADSIELNLAMGDFTCSTVEAENFNATVSMGNFTGGLVQSSSFTAEVAKGNLTWDGWRVPRPAPSRPGWATLA